MAAEGLAAVLEQLADPAPSLVRHAMVDELVLWLPRAGDGPAASPELVRAPAAEPARAAGRAGLAPWRVPALTFTPRAAVGLLPALDEPAALGPDLVPGGSVPYLAAVAALAGDLASRGRTLPALRDEAGDHLAQWLPVLTGADAERAAELTSAMPPLCRATDGRGQASAEALGAALDALTDAAVRTRLVVEPALALIPARRGRRPARVPVAERWAHALTSTDPLLPTTGPEDEEEAARLSAALAEWRAAAQLPAGPVRTCFRLIEPAAGPGDRAAGDQAGGDQAGGDQAGGDRAGGDQAGGDQAGGDRASGDQAGGDRASGDQAAGDEAAGDEAGGGQATGDGGQAASPDDSAPGPGPAGDGTSWTVQLALQSTEDPSLLLPAEDIWAGATTGSWAAAGVAQPEEELLTGLGRAARLFPELERELRDPAPTALRTDTAGAFRFLKETAPLLSGAGFGVLLPAWARRARLGLRLTTRSRGTSTASASEAKFGLADLVDFRYDLAIGDDTVDAADLEELARLKVPLVRLRGHWVELDHRQLQAALRFLQRDRSGTMTAADALLAGTGGSGPAQDATGGPGWDGDDEELPVLQIDADGWLGDLLSGQADRRLEPVPTPAGFRGELRPYQQRGLAWLSFLGSLGLGGILADDMGLGKTIALLALLAHEREQPAGPAAAVAGPTLLACPMSLVGNWQREAERFTPELRVHVHHGADRLAGAELAAALNAADLVITTYGIAARDREALAQVKWKRVTCDEAQNIKNAATRQAQAVRALPAVSRLALTGTPVENRLSELWSIMEFTSPGLLGPAERFRRRFAVPIERSGDEDATRRLRQLTGPFILRRLKTDKSIISDLPDKLEMKVWCNLTPEQASLYQATVTDMLARIEAAEEGIERRGLVLATMAKLKQVCNHPAHLLGDGSRLPGRSGKLARLEEICDEVTAEGDKALCFTQYAEFGRMLQPHLAARLGCQVRFLHGGTPKRQRDAMVSDFQAETDPSVFILSLKAGGTGLNLTAASHVIHVDRWWNPAVEDQATDRAFRIGQRRDVQVRKFVCVGTVEERIDAMIEEKKALAERIVGSGESWLTELSVDDLRKVIELSPEAVSE
jgi:SNF2 family DNA or RNA helicase